eukprot:SAG31_NODE_325_length_17671_cov_9.902743_2_plen_89_part_00
MCCGAATPSSAERSFGNSFCCLQKWMQKFQSAKKSGLSSLELLMRDKDYGLTVGKYKLAELLNEGGFAKVKSGKRRDAQSIEHGLPHG